MRILTRLSNRQWVPFLALLLILVFMTACTTTPTPRRWVDPDFAKGTIPISRLELLPMSLGVNVDGMSRATWAELRKNHKKIGEIIEKGLKNQLSQSDYKVFRGAMSRDRLMHLLRQVQNATNVSRSTGRSAGIDPVMIAGGIPGTNGVLVVEAFANIKTGGKTAAQVSVVVVLIAVIVLVVVAAIIAQSGKDKKGKKSKRKKSKSKSKRSSSRRARSSNSRTYRRYKTKRQYRRYRVSYRRSRMRRIRRSRVRYYRGRYRAYDGRYRTYRVTRYRPYRRRPRVFFYMPLYTHRDSNIDRYPTKSRQEDQPFFSSSFLDLGITIIEKGTGIILLHDKRRWFIDPTSPSSIRSSFKRILADIPRAQKLPAQPPMAPPGTQPGNPPVGNPPPGQPPAGHPPAHHPPTGNPPGNPPGQPPVAPPVHPPGTPPLQPTPHGAQPTSLQPAKALPTVKKAQPTTKRPGTPTAKTAPPAKGVKPTKTTKKSSKKVIPKMKLSELVPNTLPPAPPARSAPKK